MAGPNSSVQPESEPRGADTMAAACLQSDAVAWQGSGRCLTPWPAVCTSDNGSLQPDRQHPQLIIMCILGLWQVPHSLAALHLQEGSLLRARRFLCKGARLNEAVDAQGNTLLHLASAAGQVEMVQAFLDAGADAEARNQAGGLPCRSTSQELAIWCLLCMGCCANAAPPLVPTRQHTPRLGAGSRSARTHLVSTLPALLTAPACCLDLPQCRSGRCVC